MRGAAGYDDDVAGADLAADAVVDALRARALVGGIRCRLNAIREHVRLAVSERAERCVMISMAQSELPDDPAVLRKIVQVADGELGVYADVTTPGRISVGDEVVVR